MDKLPQCNRSPCAVVPSSKFNRIKLGKSSSNRILISLFCIYMEFGWCLCFFFIYHCMCTEYTSFTHILRLVLIPITKSRKWKILWCYRISFFSMVDHVCAHVGGILYTCCTFFSHHSLMKHLKDRFLWVTTRVCALIFFCHFLLLFLCVVKQSLNYSWKNSTKWDYMTKKWFRI